jgi:hypothetical protein
VGGEPEFPQACSERLPCLPVVRAHRYAPASALLRGQPSRELLVRDSMMQCCVAHHGVPQYRGGLRDQLDADECVGLVEVEQRDQPGAKIQKCSVGRSSRSASSRRRLRIVSPTALLRRGARPGRTARRCP